MHPPVMFPVVPGVQFLSLAFHSDGVQVEAATTVEHAACPNCGRVSTRVHSRSVRSLTDRPLTATPLRYRLTVRRFVCGNDACPRRVFAEPLPELAPPRARTTAALTAAHPAIGFTAGGEPGSRLAHALAMPTSPDTPLRRVRAAHLDPGPPPRYVGLDDWAVKKGQQYGTMVVDLERGRVVALLPGRDGKAVPPHRLLRATALDSAARPRDRPPCSRPAGRGSRRRRGGRVAAVLPPGLAHQRRHTAPAGAGHPADHRSHAPCVGGG